jgi:hypothetical protein
VPLRILRWDEEQGVYDAPDRMGVPDRFWRATIPFGSGHTHAERELLVQALRAAAIDTDMDGEGATCYAEEPTDRKAFRSRLVKTARTAGLGHMLPDELHVLRWEPGRWLYVDPDVPEPPSPLDPRNIRWLVDVEVRDVFAFGDLIAELEAEGRTTLDQKGWAFEVGAKDEADALGLAARLGARQEIAAAVPRELSAFGRWRVRQRLLGNYGVSPAGEITP